MGTSSGKDYQDCYTSVFIQSLESMDFPPSVCLQTFWRRTSDMICNSLLIRFLNSHSAVTRSHGILTTLFPGNVFARQAWCRRCPCRASVKYQKSWEISHRVPPLCDVQTGIVGRSAAAPSPSSSRRPPRPAGCRAGGVLTSSEKLEPAESPRGVRPWILGTSLGVGTSAPDESPY